MPKSKSSVIRDKKSKLPGEITNEDEFKLLKSVMERKQIKFADQYLLTLNQLESYKAAGYKADNIRSMRAAASRLLNDNLVQLYITYIFKQRANTYSFQEQRILSKLDRFSKAKITDYFDIKNGKIYLKDLHKLPPDAIDSIESIKETVAGIEIKLVNKLSANVTLGKHFGMFQQKEQSTTIGSGKTFFIIKTYVVPTIKNVMIEPTINEGTTLDMIRQYISERNKTK